MSCGCNSTTTYNCLCCCKEQRKLQGLIGRLDGWLCSNRAIATALSGFSNAQTKELSGKVVPGSYYNLNNVFGSGNSTTRILLYRYDGCLCTQSVLSVALRGSTALNGTTYGSGSCYPDNTDNFSVLVANASANSLLSSSQGVSSTTLSALRIAINRAVSARMLYQALLAGLSCQ